MKVKFAQAVMRHGEGAAAQPIFSPVRTQVAKPPGVLTPAPEVDGLCEFQL